jgi:hypothetical protein
VATDISSPRHNSMEAAMELLLHSSSNGARRRRNNMAMGRLHSSLPGLVSYPVFGQGFG